MRITPMVPWIALAGVIAYVSWFDRWPTHSPVTATPTPELPAQFAANDVVAQAGSGKSDGYPDGLKEVLEGRG